MAPDTPFREPEMKDTPPFQGPDTARGISQEIPLAFLKERCAIHPYGVDSAPLLAVSSIKHKKQPQIAPVFSPHPVDTRFRTC